jgi:hypothetical protein
LAKKRGVFYRGKENYTMPGWAALAGSVAGNICIGIGLACYDDGRLLARLGRLDESYSKRRRQQRRRGRGRRKGHNALPRQLLISLINGEKLKRRVKVRMRKKVKKKKGKRYDT